MKVELLRAWPRRFERTEIELVDGSRVADALSAAGWADDPEAVAYALFGVRVDGRAVLHDGDRIELLRPLQADPKDARRRRADQRRTRPGVGRAEERKAGERTVDESRVDESMADDSRADDSGADDRGADDTRG